MRLIVYLESNRQLLSIIALILNNMTARSWCDWHLSTGPATWLSLCMLQAAILPPWKDAAFVPQYKACAMGQVEAGVPLGRVAALIGVNPGTIFINIEHRTKFR